MTENQAIEHWEMIIGRRLRKILRLDSSPINAVMAQVMTALGPGTDPGPLGTCTYTINGMTVVQPGVTQAECEDKLGGSWVPDP